MRSIKLLLVLSMAALWTCQPTPFFSQKTNLALDGWLYEKPVSFQFEVLDTSKRYDLALQIDHQTTYEYQNLYIYLTTIFPNQDSINQPLSVDLADAQGRWFGECSTRKCRVEIALQQNTFFNQIGKHQLVISQHMRVDPVVDIDALTLSLIER